MAKYAEGTSVSPERSQAEIQKTLSRYGATAFAFATDDDLNAAAVAFKAHGRQVRFMLPLPVRDHRDFLFTTTGQRRSPAGASTAYQQELRRRWRALAMAIKAKLEVVESGIVSFEDEFAVHMVLPDGSTVGQWLAPQIDEAYRTGRMPELLPGAERLAIEGGESR
jgi:hypothetical protein